MLLTRYIMTAIPPQSIDCFGFTCPLGMAAVEAESHDSVWSILNRFKLNDIIKTNTTPATVITDRGQAWSSPLSQYTPYHYFDCFHFNRDIQTHKSDSFPKYQEDMRRAVFSIFPNDEELLQHLACIEQYATGDGKTLLSFLKKNRHQLCVTHTTKQYVGSYQGASSRIEGFMSSLKGKGTLKRQMQEWNLYELFMRHETVVDNYIQKVHKTLAHMVKNNYQFTPFVLEALQKATMAIHHYSLVSQSESADGEQFFVCKNSVNAGGNSVLDLNDPFKLYVDELELKTYHSLVFIPKDPNVNPTCNCRIYTSMNLPCGCIAFSMVHMKKVKRSFISQSTLHRQWRHELHPLYAESISKTYPSIRGMDFLPTTTPSTVAKQSSIHFPKKEQQRMSILAGINQKISNVAITEPGLYRRAVVATKGLLDFLTTSKDSDGGINLPAVPLTSSNILPPILKKGRKHRRSSGSTVTLKAMSDPHSDISQKAVQQARQDLRSPSESLSAIMSSNIPQLPTSMSRDIDMQNTVGSKEMSLPFDYDSSKRVDVPTTPLEMNALFSSQLQMSPLTLKTSNRGLNHSPLSLQGRNLNISFPDDSSSPSLEVQRSPTLSPPFKRSRRWIPSSTSSSPSLSDPDYINLKVNKITERRLRKEGPSVSISSTTDDEDDGSLTESEKKRNRTYVRNMFKVKRWSYDPTQTYPCLEHSFDGHILYLKVGYTILYYGATARFGDESWKRTGKVVDIRKDLENDWMLATDSCDHVYKHQWICIIDPHMGHPEPPFLLLGNFKEKVIQEGTDSKMINETSNTLNVRRGSSLDQSIAHTTGLNEVVSDNDAQMVMNSDNDKFGSWINNKAFMPWGFTYQDVKYTNSCPLDSVLQLLHYIDRDYHLPKESTPQQVLLKQVFNLLFMKNYNDARGIFLTKVLCNGKYMDESGGVDLKRILGEEHKMNESGPVDLWTACLNFVKGIDWFRYQTKIEKLSTACTCTGISKSKVIESYSVSFHIEGTKDTNLGGDSITTYYERDEPSFCSYCKCAINRKRTPISFPLLMYINASGIRVQSVSREIKFGEINYVLVGVIYRIHSNHFFCKYLKGSTFSMYDGLRGLKVHQYGTCSEFYHVHEMDCSLDGLFYVKEECKKQYMI